MKDESQPAARIFVHVLHPSSLTLHPSKKDPGPKPGVRAKPRLAASMAVAAGIMQPTADGAFQPTRPVTGAEAASAIDGIRALIGSPATTVSDRR